MDQSIRNYFHLILNSLSLEVEVPALQRRRDACGMVTELLRSPSGTVLGLKLPRRNASGDYVVDKFDLTSAQVSTALVDLTTGKVTLMTDLNDTGGDAGLGPVSDRTRQVTVYRLVGEDGSVFELIDEGSDGDIFHVSTSTTTGTRAGGQCFLFPNIDRKSVV